MSEMLPPLTSASPGASPASTLRPKSKSVEEAIRDFAKQDVSDGIARFSFVRINGVLCELLLTPRRAHPFVNDTDLILYQDGCENASLAMARGLNRAAALREGFSEAYERLLSDQSSSSGKDGQ